MKSIIDLYREKIFTEDGEELLRLAEVIRRYSDGGWTKGKLEIALNMVRAGLGELSKIKEFDPHSIDKVSKQSGIPVSDLGIMAMIVSPENYLPMDETMISLSKIEGIRTDNYQEFLKGWRKFLKDHQDYFDDFLDLYMVVSDKKIENTNKSIIEEIIRMVEKLDFLSIDEKTIKTFEDIYPSFLPSDREKIAGSIRDPYVSGVLIRNGKVGIIVDGSNISMINSPHPDLMNIFRAFESLGNMKNVPWPFKIIFDANIEYTLHGSQKVLFAEKFQKHPCVKLYSPADELILELAKTSHFWILSNDRYLDYPKVDAVTLRFDGKTVWKDSKN